MTVKEQLRQLVDQLPDTATCDEFTYELYVRQKIERGVADIEGGRLIPHECSERSLSDRAVERARPQ